MTPTKANGSILQMLEESKAEEENWSAAALSLAAVMMPDHPNVEAWTRRNIELLLIAYIRYRYMRSPLASTIFQVIVGGGIVFGIGLWLGKLGAGG